MTVTDGNTDRELQQNNRRVWIKEPFCGLSHGLGAALSVVGLVVLLVLARGRPWHTVAFAIYGVSLILLYTASALYHWLPVGPPQVTRLMRLDHTAIFLLIAGTFAPVCLISLRGGWGWGLLAAEYGLAAVGIASLLWKRVPHAARVVLYLLMGWISLIAMGPLRAALSPTAFAWLIGGGLVYTAGAVIFAVDRPHLWPGRFSAHDLWHIFVLGGSACHFLLMLCLV